MTPPSTPDTQEIVVDEVFPHPTEAIWKALTSGELMDRWIMAPSGFEPVVGCRFTFQTTTGRSVGRRHPLPGAGGEAERTLRL